MTVRTGRGSPSASLMVVGEAFGESEERTGQPFMGASGIELGRMLLDAKINTSDVYYTNVVNARPPANNLELWVPSTKSRVTSDMVRCRDRFVKPIVAEGFQSLIRELELVSPKVVIPVGTIALWALTGKWGILKWRGSMLEVDTEEMKSCLLR